MTILQRVVVALRHQSDIRVHFLIQSLGTLLSQIIPLAMAPILTRLFLPDDFGWLGSIVSISAVLAIVFTFRVDHGVMVAVTDVRAKMLAQITLLCALGGAMLFSIGSLAVLSALKLQDSRSLILWCVLVPIAAFSVAALRTVTLYNNRLKLFRRVSVARIMQAAVTAFLSALLGFFAFTQFGLVVGLLVGQIVYIGLLMQALLPLIEMSIESTKSLISANMKFIRFSLPADLVNVLSWRLPFLVFPAMFGLEATGYLALAYTVVATPTRFIGNALGEVFYAHGVKQYQETGTCWPTARKISWALALMSLMGFLTLFVIAGPAFAIVFGDGWADAAHYTQILIPMIAVRFVASPLSVVFYIAGQQKADFLWQSAFLATTIMSILIGGWLYGIEAALALFSLSGCFMYAVYFVLIRHFSNSLPDEAKSK